MLARFNGNVVPFADDATSTNRTVFGGTTQSDTLDDNLNADFKKGWEIIGLNDNPTREDFNAMGYTLGALTAYLYEMGISEWNASQNYRIGSRVIGSDGKIYKALTGTTGAPNVNHNPISDTINWEWELKAITDYSILTAKTTPVDADLLALGDSASSFGLKKLSWANLKTVLFGSPTLTGTPTAPTPASSDDSTKIATTAWNKLGFAYSFTANGYLKFPTWMGGLIFQWGITSLSSASDVTVNLPTTFPNGLFNILSTYSHNVGGAAEGYVTGAKVGTTNISQIILRGTTTVASSAYWFAIGN